MLTSQAGDRGNFPDNISTVLTGVAAENWRFWPPRQIKSRKNFGRSVPASYETGAPEFPAAHWHIIIIDYQM